MKQKTRSKEEWKRLVCEYRESGKSLREWCGERGINPSTMSNHTPLYPSAKKPQNVHRSEGEWIALIQEQRNSGKSRERWCDENNINHKSMGSAVKRYANRIEDINNRNEMLENKTRNKKIPGEASVKIDTPGCKTGQLVESMTNPSWVEIGIETEMNPEEAGRLEAPVLLRTEALFPACKTSERPKHQAEVEEKKSKIRIRCGKLEIEADDDYPSSHLENLIGKLVAVC